ncbi:MAG: T9SS type A sorting domain-containing protein [Bacteroidales bacterium]|nr:T9SS type A sorting domain-containing protein [Bacteroidales bacterium]
MRKRLLTIVLILIASLTASAQNYSMGWDPAAANAIYSNCPSSNTTIRAFVVNNSSTTLAECFAECTFTVADHNSDTVIDLAPGDTAWLTVLDMSLQPGDYNLEVKLHGTSTKISTNVHVIYCRNVGINEIITPTATGSYVEGEPITLRARFTNYGATDASSGNYWWPINVDGETISPSVELPPMAHGESVEGTWVINPPMGYYGQQKIVIKIYANDQYTLDNQDSVYINLIPAYDPKAVSIHSISDSCNMTQVPISMKMVNNGGKPFQAGDIISIGYTAIAADNSLTIPNLPINHSENYTLTSEWAVGDTLTVTFSQRANLYPTNLLQNIQVILQGWCHFDMGASRLDHILANDTTPTTTITSLYSPNAPTVADANIPYATRTTITASQSESLPIHWYADTNDAAFISSNVYARTTTYNSPQMFRDTVFYLRSRAANGCWSKTSATHINLSRQSYDAGATVVMRPAEGDTCTESDTVQIRVCNYGNFALTNTPVAFEARRITSASSDLFQTSYDTIRTTIIPDACIDFTFTPLLNFPVQYINQTNRYSITAWTEHPQDYVAQNDTVCDTVSLTVIPAYNIKAVAISTTDGNCRMFAEPVSISFVNIGLKTIPANDTMLIGYQASTTVSGVTTLPTTHIEYYSIPTDWAVGDTINITFNAPANLYPTGVLQDIPVRLKGWCHYNYNGVRKDIINNNDTTNIITINSLHAPDAPVVTDLHIPYATRTVIHASQSEGLPISWYNDTLATPFFGPSDYTNDTMWRTPQYFADTLYYLRSLGTNGCYSDFGVARVILNPRVPIDLGVAEVILPQQEMVYTENDTVRIRICNYGTDTAKITPVSFNIHRIVGASRTITQIADDTILTPIAPDQCAIHTFEPLAIIPENYRNTDNNYVLRAWTSHPNDPVPQNDTLYDDYIFRTMPETDYCMPTITTPKSIDIVSVHYNMLANEVSPIGHGPINFGLYDTTQRVTPALHVTRGTTDSLVVGVENSADLNDDTTVCTLIVLIDYNRDANFDGTGEVIRTTTVVAGGRTSIPLTISNSAHYGYMRMRLMVMPGANNVMTACMTMDKGAVHDYLIYVDPMPADTDAAVVRFAIPTSPIISSPTQPVEIVVANRGSQMIQLPVIHYQYISRDTNTNESGSFPWVGNIAPGRSVNITLPAHTFPLGTTDIIISVETQGDTIHSNDTLRYQVHRFHTYRALYIENYDITSRTDDWYAPRGEYRYNRNLWELGFPTSSVINSTYSGNNAWATDLDNIIITGLEGNRSVLYSPLFDISISRPDTLSVYLNQNFANGSRLIVEFLDLNGNWQRLQSSNSAEWYSNANGFINTNSEGYQLKCVKMGIYAIQVQLGNITQFRFIYTADISNTPKNYNDGCAIDNFRLGHMRGHIDVGAVEVTAATAPQVRRRVYPWVIIHNFGLDTIYATPVEYLVYGDTEYVRETYTGCIAPGESDTHFFQTPFVCGLNFPDTFPIWASTSLATDIYWENDSIRTYYVIAPTDDDIALTEYLTPRSKEIATDTVEVTLRMCNNGSYAIPNVYINFDYNAQYQYEDTIDFIELLGGEGLLGEQCCNYTIPDRYHVSIGITSLKTYVVMPYDIKAENDTLEALFSGLTNARDLEALDIIVDASHDYGVTVQLGIHNGGAQMVNAFDMGFYIDNDTATTFRQHVSDLAINALSISYRTFDTILPHREMGYNEVTAFVYIDEDIDISNDTTSLIAEPFIDVRVIKAIVQENEEEACRVRVQLINLGNFTLTDTYKIIVTINGETLIMECNTPLPPAQYVEIELDVRLTKSKNRTYVGNVVVNVPGDDNPADNQTTIVETVSKFLSIDNLVADNGSLWLGQNYPNPADERTSFDFSLASPSAVSIYLFDLSGRTVYMAKGFYGEGRRTHTINTARLNAGIYYYMVQTAEARKINKMIVR